MHIWRYIQKLVNRFKKPKKSTQNIIWIDEMAPEINIEYLKNKVIDGKTFEEKANDLAYKLRQKEEEKYYEIFFKGNWENKTTDISTEVKTTLEE